MIKAILFDGDGMLINKPLLFSQHLSRDYNVPIEIINEFFKTDFQPCLIGRADLKEVIKPHLKLWNWPGTVEELLNYWFASENYIDPEIIKSIVDFKAAGLKCYLHSNQEAYRADYMTEVMGLDKIMDDIFSSAHLGVKKPEQTFWRVVTDILSPLNKNEILVWDDDPENVKSAKQFGLNAELYTNYQAFTETMKKYL